MPCAEGTTAPNCLELALGSDPQGALFDPALQGSIGRLAGRFLVPVLGGQPHIRRHAGAASPSAFWSRRGHGLQLPAGNEDIIYLIYTFYNVTSTDPAAYAAVRPGHAGDTGRAGRAVPGSGTSACFEITFPA